MLKLRIMEVVVPPWLNLRNLYKLLAQKNDERTKVDILVIVLVLKTNVRYLISNI